MKEINYSLMLASQGDDLGRVESLLAAGADASVRTRVMHEGPLFRAAAHGTKGICKALINAGADVNAEDAYGETPLHWAVSEGNLGTVQALLDAGASVTAGACSVRVMAYKAMTSAYNALLKDLAFYGPVLEHRSGRNARVVVDKRRREASARAEILEILLRH